MTYPAWLHTGWWQGRSILTGEVHLVSRVQWSIRGGPVQPLSKSDPAMVGPYRLAGRLGAGAMGQVYLGISRTADQVAVKMVKPGVADEAHLKERFRTEVDNLRRVYGARVARFEGAGFDGDQPWLAVEYVAGRSLKQHVEASGPIGTEAVAMLGAFLTEGLEKIHLEGLLHRDLKPQNILLGPDGPKIIDFGLAMFVQRDVQLTTTGMLVGTLAYMPPEQTDDSNELTAAADVYALAATLAYVATGRSLYGDIKFFALLSRLRNPADRPDLSGISPPLAAVLEPMLAHQPADRPSLTTVSDQLLAVAVYGGRTVEQARAEFIAATRLDWVDPVVPVELTDPLAEDDDDEDDQAMHAELSGPVSQAEPDISWLVDDIRRRYDRQPTL